MIFSPSTAAGSRPELARHLARTLGKLTVGGLRLTFEWPEEVCARQTAWPKDAALTEAQLRTELESIVETAKALGERARRLCEQLPETSDAELEDEVPQGLYYVLCDALIVAGEDAFEDSVRYLERALAATPESLRTEWLSRQLKGGLKPLGAEDAELLLSRLVRVIDSAEPSRAAE